MKTKKDLYIEEILINKLQEESQRTGLSFSRIIEQAIENRYPILSKKEGKLKCQA